MISIQAVVQAVMYLIVAGVIWWLLHRLISRANPTEPFKKVAGLLLDVFAVFVVIGVLLGLVGVPIFVWR